MKDIKAIKITPSIDAIKKGFMYISIKTDKINMVSFIDLEVMVSAFNENPENTEKVTPDEFNLKAGYDIGTKFLINIRAEGADMYEFFTNKEEAEKRLSYFQSIMQVDFV